MSRKKRMQDLRQAKDRRMKKIAIGGGVVLVAVLAFEMSHMLGGHKAAAPAATTTATTAAAGATTSTTPTSTPTSSPTTAAGSASAAALPTTGSTKLPNSDVAPSRSKSQLDSFSDFAGKDPFAQQLSSSSQLSTATTGSSSTPAATPAATAPTATAAAKVTVGSAKQGSSARTLAKFGAATISVNGRSQLVRVGASFPSSSPLFRLVSITHGVARIGIASGSYTSGAHTVSLAAGHTLTLVDTADGIRYKLRLVTG
jgi:flagellar hook-length control protein FliK